MTPPNPPTPQSVSSTGTGEPAHNGTLGFFNSMCPCKSCSYTRAYLHEKHVGSPATPPKMNAGETPQPILPGVPVPFPCWLKMKVSGWCYLYGGNQWAEAAIQDATHYLIAPVTADPATFPKAETAPVKKGNTDRLRMDYINSLPQPFIAHLYGGSEWPVNDIEVATGLLRIDVCGKLEVKHIGDVSFFIDASGTKHDSDTFYTEEPPSAGTEQKELGEASRAFAMQDLGKTYPTYEQEYLTLPSALDAIFALDDEQPKSWYKEAEKIITSLMNSKRKPALPTDGTTPTPRTDAVTTQYDGDYKAPLAFTRQLERELALAEKRLGEERAYIKKMDGILEEVGGVTVSCINPYFDLKHALETLKEKLATSQARLVEVEVLNAKLKTRLDKTQA